MNNTLFTYLVATIVILFCIYGWVIVAGLILTRAKHGSPPKRPSVLHYIICITFCIALTSIYSKLTISSIIYGQKDTNIILHFIATMLFWTCTFHVSARMYGYRISSMLEKFPVLAHNWVRSIYYIYIILGTTSLLRLLMDYTGGKANTEYFIAYSTVGLGIAVTLRITKTSIEIFSWDKPPSLRPT